MQIEAFGKVFVLLNDEKYKRATEGTIGRGGTLVGGVGTDATGEVIMAEYDRMAGAIRLNGDKVKRGCFYDFAHKKAIEQPEIRLEFNINGKITDVLADEPLPPIVRAAKEAEQGNFEEGEAESDAEEAPKKRGTTFIGGGKKRAVKSEE